MIPWKRIKKMTKKKKNKDLENVGWTICYLECADNTLYAVMTRNLKKELIEIGELKKGIYFTKHPERLPVKVVFKETNLIFKEARAKYTFMKKMNKTMKLRLIETKKWPIGGALREYILSREIV